MLDTGQQKDLLQYILNRERAGISLCAVNENYYLKNNSTKLLTEIQEGNLYFCLEERSVCVEGRKIELTVKEFDALHLLIINRKRVLTFETIAYQVWGEEYIDVTPKTIHNLMSRLRQKLQVDPSGPEYVKSVRGVGYKFDAGL